MVCCWNWACTGTPPRDVCDWKSEREGKAGGDTVRVPKRKQTTPGWLCSVCTQIPRLSAHLPIHSHALQDRQPQPPELEVGAHPRALRDTHTVDSRRVIRSAWNLCL